jgi:hypothetical protein
MKFVKRLNFNRYRPTSQSFIVAQDGKIVTDSTAELQLPKGTTNQRALTYSNGQIRYNSEFNEIEAYINGQWEFLRTRRQATITFQSVATGNYVNTIFGPLSYRQDPNKPENVFVFVENVYQVPTVNYTLVNDPVVTKLTVGVTNPGVTNITVADKVDLNVGQTIGGDVSIAPGTVIQQINTQTNSIRISSATLGVIQAGVGLTFAFSTGTFVTFTSPPPEKPIYALNGFDGYYPPFTN